MNQLGLILGIIICQILSCCSVEEERTQLITVKFDIDFATPCEISDKNYITNLSIIKLDFNDKESVIGGIDKIQIVENTIFILDKFQSKSLFCFDDTGKFMFRIHQIGKGPGEFILPEDFIVQNERIYIYDNFRKRKISYDLQGNFIEEVQVNHFVSNVENYTKDTVLIRPHSNNEYNYNLLATDSNLQSEYFRFIPVYYQSEGIFSINKAFSKYNEHVLFTYGFNDTIYNYHNGLLYPYLYIDFGRNKIPIDLISSESDDYKNKIFDGGSRYVGLLDDISENRNLITLTISDFSNRKHCLLSYSKTKNEGRIFDRIYVYEHEFRMSPPKTVYNEQFISVVYHSDINENAKLHSEVGNPLLIKYSLTGL
ncbi:MAG: 6-bladed beta-propeller [Bacteroidota bacterium]